jgi:hypothetical protein
MKKKDLIDLWAIIKSSQILTNLDFQQKTIYGSLTCKTRKTKNLGKEEGFKIYILDDMLILNKIKHSNHVETNNNNNSLEEEFETNFMIKDCKIIKSQPRKFKIDYKDTSYQLKTNNDEELNKYL